jgi:serine protease Do
VTLFRINLARTLGVLACLGLAGVLFAQQSFTPTAREVNRRLVKLFGAGGFKGLPSYGTGVIISPKGYLLTVNNHILSTSDLRVHLYDGRSYHAKVKAREPDLDLAVLQIEEDVDFLPYYDLELAAKRPIAEAGDWVLAFTNCFQIATRDEPMSIQRGVIAAYTELRGRRGVFDAAYQGDVYFIDAITNNPGAAGGIVTTRKGDLLGFIGRELKNNLTDTWINYAVPVQAKVDYIDKDKKSKTLTVVEFAKLAIAGNYEPREKSKQEVVAGFTGIVLVPNPVSATPPYVEEVVPGSPAAKAGLKPDDLIVYVEGELVPTVKHYRDFVRTMPPGHDLKLDIQRGTKLHHFEFKIADVPKAKTGG